MIKFIVIRCHKSPLNARLTSEIIDQHEPSNSRSSTKKNNVWLYLSIRRWTRACQINQYERQTWTEKKDTIHQSFFSLSTSDCVIDFKCIDWSILPFRMKRRLKWMNIHSEKNGHRHVFNHWNSNHEEQQGIGRWREGNTRALHQNSEIFHQQGKKWTKNCRCFRWETCHDEIRWISQ